MDMVEEKFSVFFTHKNVTFFVRVAVGRVQCPVEPEEALNQNFEQKEFFCLVNASRDEYIKAMLVIGKSCGKSRARRRLERRKFEL